MTKELTSKKLVSFLPGGEKVVGFHSGKNTVRVYEPDGTAVTWEKSGGYAAHQIEKSLALFEAADFSLVRHNDASSPSGSVVGHGACYQDGKGNRLEVSACYGVTKEGIFA